MPTLYLIGFMGSGKSTVATEIAQKIEGKFIDTDIFIEEKYNMSIPSIFKLFGEDTFREYEVEALKDCAHYPIVATGGGIVERKENIDTMNRGVIIYLKTSFEEIDRRLKNDQTRPLWNRSKQDQKRLYERRIKLYEKYAHKEIVTTNKKVSEIADEIITYLHTTSR